MSIKNSINKKALGYKGHIAVSILSFILFLMLNTIIDFFNYSYIIIFPLFLIVLLYGLLPDIDTTESKLGKAYLIFSLLVLTYTILVEMKILSLIILAILGFFVTIRHRGFTHTVVGGIIFAIPLLWVGIDYFIVALLSYFSHLIADGKIKWY